MSSPSFLPLNLEPSITIKNSPASAEIDLLRSRLLAFNRSHVPDPNYRPLLLTVSGGTGEMAGGLFAQLYHSWMFVELLWVEEELRGRGIGARLLAQAEEQAREHGCHSAWLDTFGFQAPNFYRKQGYEVFGELPRYPDEHRRYFFCKKLG